MTIFSFLDVETTGLSPQEDFILEIAWQLADDQFNPLGEPRTFLINQEDEAAATKRVLENPYVLKMHRESGLWADMAVKSGISMTEALNRFQDDVVSVRKPDEQVRLAGYSVSFDREFLKANGWYDLFETDRLDFQMHHRIMDLSSVIQMWQAADLQEPSTWNDNPHRALDDALDSLAKAQAFRDELSMLKAYFGG